MGNFKMGLDEKVKEEITENISGAAEKMEATVESLEDVREEINDIDAEIAELFEKRMNACAEVARYKKAHGLSIRDEAREKALIDRIRSNIHDPDIESYYIQLQQKMIDLSCKYQGKIIEGMQVAYCGVEGAFAHIAADRMFPGAVLVSCEDFEDAYRAVEDGKYDCAVFPLENNYAGEVGKVMDLIFSGNLFVNQVMDLSVTHNLIACKGADMSKIKKVISHPQALQQCDAYIREHGFETASFSNTAVAAKFVKESGDPTIAAIASKETADIFDLDILEERINDAEGNSTRFVALSRVQNKPSSMGIREDENFILVFTVQNKAGALALNYVCGIARLNFGACLKGKLYNPSISGPTSINLSIPGLIGVNRQRDGNNRK